MTYKCKAKGVKVWNCWESASEMDVSMVQYIALFLAGGRVGWWTGLLGIVRWWGLGVYLLGTSVWQSQLYFWG